MVPPRSALPDVLPTDRLNATGKALAPLREELRYVASWRNAWTVTWLWAVIIGLFAGAVWIDHPLGYVVLLILMGPMFARLAILGHEAAHRLLFRNRRANDLVGRWLLDYPAFVPFDLYRRVHFAHHKDEFGAGSRRAPPVRLGRDALQAGTRQPPAARCGTGRRGASGCASSGPSW